MGKGNSQIMAINLMISMRTVVSGRYDPPFAEVCLRFGARTHERDGTHMSKANPSETCGTAIISAQLALVLT